MDSNSKTKPQVLAWAAWVFFIISLFMPIEGHTLPLKAPLFCSGGMVYCGYQNALYFVISPLFLLINLVSSIQAAIAYPEILGASLRIVFGMALYTLIGLGQILVLLAPFWPVKIMKSARQKLHFWLLLLGTLCVIAYGLFPDIRMGVDLMNGYFVWAFSFLLLLAASAWMLFSKSPKNEIQPVTPEA